MTDKERPIIDDFSGDNAKLIDSARALIRLSDSGSLAPHGIGGHARAILSAFIVRTEAAALAQTAGVGPLSGKYGDVLRPFVIQMERELHANACKGDRPGWLKMSPEVALLEIYYHLAKLQKAVKDDNGPGIQEYAADVANMSMMLLDICGGLALIEYAAPSASGVHPDALPDGTLSKSTAKRLAAASVSERARELLAAEYSKCGMQQCAADIRSGVFAAAQQLAVNAIKAALEQKVPSGEVAIVCDWRGADPFPTFIEAEVGGKSISLEWRDRPNGLKELIVPVTDSALRALEQALTQQRWHGTTGSMEQAEKATFVPCDCGCGRSCCAMCGNDVGFITPQPSADAVRELVKRWRELSVKSHRDGQYQGYDTLRLCADELESLLSAAIDHQQNAAQGGGEK